METYVLGTVQQAPFELPKDDDNHREWAKEEIAFRPIKEQGVIKLLSPITWKIIDTFELEPCELVLSAKVISLEISEHSQERKQLIAVGTSITKGEDLATRGAIYIFDISSVIPEPDRPETDRKLKLVAKEEVRGAVTAVAGLSQPGFLLMAQGQKCMVRGLKEDGSLLPVAFMDMQCYSSVVKELKGTGMCIFGDALKGLWFVGFSVSSELPSIGHVVMNADQRAKYRKNHID